MKWSLLYLACFLVCTGYGITFAAFGIMIGLMDISGAWVGFNAALPAIGWIIGSLLIPFLQLKFGVHIKNIAISFLTVSIVGVFIPFASTDYFGLSVTRLIFGGAMGAFLRCVEYIMVANTSSSTRGRFLAFYGVTFLVGLIVGSLIQPIFASNGLFALVTAAALFTAGLLVFCFVQMSSQPVEILPESQNAAAIFPVLPIAFLGVFAYAMYESVPAYLLQVFTVRSGLGEDIAAYTLSAAALGNLLLVFPILALSDRIGRIP